MSYIRSDTVYQEIMHEVLIISLKVPVLTTHFPCKQLLLIKKMFSSCEFSINYTFQGQYVLIIYA